MGKLLKLVGFVLPVLLFFMGCGHATPSGVDKKGAALDVWETTSGSFVRQDSSQYNNAVLSMKYLSNRCVAFQFKLMAGSESEKVTKAKVIFAVMLIDHNDVGRYETEPDAERPMSIKFVLSGDGKQVKITHTGEPDISPDGVYDFTEANLEASTALATSIIKNLPTAATSLNRNLGAYTIRFSDKLVSSWFYPTQATFDDTGKVLAKFLIAKDLSAIYRADDDSKPVLIFGSAQPMLDATALYWKEANRSAKGKTRSEGAYEKKPVALVKLEKSAFLTKGESSKLIAVLPWKLPYALKAISSDTSVIIVDKQGRVKAVGVGRATISGTLLVDKGTKEFTIEVFVR